MPDLERIQQLTPGTLSQQWYEDGTAVDPGTVTVGIARADGTVLVASGATTTGGGAAARTFNLTTTHTSLLDRLTVTWTSTLKGTLVSYVEVVGGFLFTIAQARTAIGDAVYDAGKIDDARTYAETELERGLGFALVPRYSRDILSGIGTGRRYWGVRLPHPYIRTIRSITVDGTALGVSDLANVTFDGSFIYGYGWPCGYGNIVVGYEHGLDTPPPGASKAALDEALAYLGDSAGGGSVDARAESIVTADGTIRLRASGSANLLSASASNWVASNRLVSIA